MNNYRRLILEAGHNDTILDQVAEELGWIHLETIYPEESDVYIPHEPYEKIWQTNGATNHIHLIYDSMLDIPYLHIEGKKLKKMVSLIASKIAVEKEEHIFNLFHQAESIPDYVYAIHCLGIIAPPTFDERFYDCLIKATHDDRPETRYEAFTAIAYVGWKAFKEAIEHKAANDPDEKVREITGTLIKNIKEYGWTDDPTY